MRMIGSIAEERLARVFTDYLLTLEIRSHIEPGAGGWIVWVEHDDHLDRARQELEQFAGNPGAPHYSRSAAAAAGIRRQEEKRQQRMRRNYTDVRTHWSRLARGSSPVTTGLVVICVVIGAVSFFGARTSAIEPLLITPPVYDLHGQFLGFLTLEETLRRVQVWRLLSPILIHFNILHLFFNMSMLLNIGGMIEMRRGPAVLVTLIAVSAILSNVAQYLWSGPRFGGMSGVVYALFGYVWMKTLFQSHLGLHVDRGSVIIMFAWLFACMTGFLGPIANTAHVVGLLTGMAIGIAPYLWKRLTR